MRQVTIQAHLEELDLRSPEREWETHAEFICLNDVHTEVSCHLQNSKGQGPFQRVTDIERKILA